MKQKEPLDIPGCILTLKKLAENGDLLAELSEELKVELYRAAGKLSRPDRHEAKKRNKDIKLAMVRKIAMKNRIKITPPAPRATLSVNKRLSTDCQ